MKTRRRKKPDPRADPDVTIVMPSRVRIERRHVDTTPLVQIDDLEYLADVGACDVEGAIVKVCPRINASERDTFDAAATARRLRDLGAIGVVTAPIIIPDATEHPRIMAPHLKPRDMVDVWLEEQHLEDCDRDAVREIIGGFMEAEGL